MGIFSINLLLFCFHKNYGKDYIDLLFRSLNNVFGILNVY